MTRPPCTRILWHSPRQPGRYVEAFRPGRVPEVLTGTDMGLFYVNPYAVMGFYQWRTVRQYLEAKGWTVTATYTLWGRKCANIPSNNTFDRALNGAVSRYSNSPAPEPPASPTGSSSGRIGRPAGRRSSKSSAPRKPKGRFKRLLGMIGVYVE